ncbi:MAG: hypothetical protein RL095_982 [Verrucomicrobiota bacterium]|jgi:D-sedoheptulose 7-phosphate isomerase
MARPLSFSPVSPPALGDSALNPVFHSWISALQRQLERVEITDGSGASLSPDQGFARLKELSLAARSRRSALYFVGNGASASMASHFSTDLAKNAGLATHTFSDPALLTCLANDLGSAEIFSAALNRCGRQGDVLVAISSSGSSPNILRALQSADELGMGIVTFTGMKADNPSRRLGDLNFWVPCSTYGHAETAHAALLHHWVDLLVEPRYQHE